MVIIRIQRPSRRRVLSACKACALKPQCTPAKERRITRWEHEAVQDQAAHNVASEMSLHVLAYNLRRAIAVVGVQPLISAMRA
jgi:transposase